MLSELKTLIGQPLSVSSLWRMQSLAMQLVDSESEPLAFFIIATIAGRIADRYDGEPMDGDFAEIRDSILKPFFLEVIDAFEKHDSERLVIASNTIIKAHMLSL